LEWRATRADRATPEVMLEELDVLLTGGRLSPVAKLAVRTAYDQARGDGNRIQAAQQAIAMTAEFNTLGASLPRQDRRNMGAVESPPRSNAYKAVILLFLAGGADTFNLIVPRCNEMYAEYAEMRTDLTLGDNEMAAITTPGQDCGDFGLHNSFAFLRELYEREQAGFISNVGNLVEPTTRASYRSGQSQKCVSMFSHANQQNGAQTLKCQEMGEMAKGIGGRIADALSMGADQYATASFSLAGSAVWPKGFRTSGDGRQSEPGWLP